MMPTMMNCSHQGEGWCLICVQDLNKQLEKSYEAIQPLVEILEGYEKACQGMPSWLLDKGNKAEVPIKLLRQLRDLKTI